MSTRTALTVVGGVVGAYFGYPQLGLVVGGLVGGIVDPTVIPGPKIGEIAIQTSADGVARPIIYGAMACYGNIIQTGQAVKVEGDDGGGKGEPEQATGDQVYRTYAIRICEGPVAALLRVWEDNKLVYDSRTGSPILADSTRWMANKVFYTGSEDQLPDPTLVASVNPDTPSYRGTCYMVFNTENLTNRTGSIPQYRFEVAKEVYTTLGASTIGPVNPSFVTDVNVDEDGNMLMLRDQTGGSSPFSTGSPGTFTVATYDKNNINTQINQEVIFNSGDPTSPGDDQRSGIVAINGSAENNYAVASGSLSSNASATRLFHNGLVTCNLVDETGIVGWNTGDDANGTPPLLGAMFYQDTVFMGVNRTGVRKMFKWPIGGSGHTSPIAYLIDPMGTNPFMYHVSRQGNVRLLRIDGGGINEYDNDLVFTGSRTVPAVPAGSFSNVRAFGFDEQKGMQAYLHMASDNSTLTVTVFDLNNVLMQSYPLGTYAATGQKEGKIVFSDENIFVKTKSSTFSIDAPSTFTPLTVPLSEIISDIHERCSIDSSMYDVSELTDEVAGFMLAGEYTGADAIGSPKLVYFYDKSEHDKSLYYPKRGAAVIETLTVDDLTEIPDSTVREQAIEIPKKLHLKYQHANSGYAPVKATVVSSSPDVLTTGEVSIEVPIVLDEDQAIQTADKMYKVTRAELYGQTEVVVPLYVGAKYVTGNCVGLSLRGSTKRMRIEEMVLTPDWQMKLTLKPDRQSAYTSNLTGVPIPDPTPPPSTIIGETELAVLDIPARVDFEDDLNYLVAVSGALPPWYGARYQRSFDGGANYTTVQDITTASIMGELLDPVDDASEFFTDTTNSVTVSLFRAGQTLSSISEQEFLSEGNPFALEKPDGSWEVMQFKDAHENSDGTFTLTTLHRGQLSSGTSSHSVGAKFVMLQRPSHIPAQSAWIGQDITHRAISLGESADDTTNDVTQTFVGRSQIEWTVASLKLTRDVNDVSATWEPRHRFGTANSPIASVNFQGFRVTIDGGSQGSVTFDTTNNFFTDYDTSTLGPDVIVTVSALNRITGAGPSTSKTI